MFAGPKIKHFTENTCTPMSSFYRKQGVSFWPDGSVSQSNADTTWMQAGRARFKRAESREESEHDDKLGVE